MLARPPSHSPERGGATMSRQARPVELSGWAEGGIAFAATVMLIAGVFQALNGLAALIDDQFYVVTANYAFDLDVSTWGFIHLIIGIVLILGGLGLFSRRIGAVLLAL